MDGEYVREWRERHREPGLMDIFLNGMLKMLRIVCVPTGTDRTETNRAGRTSSYRQVQAICAELTDLHVH